MRAVPNKPPLTDIPDASDADRPLAGVLIALGGIMILPVMDAVAKWVSSNGAMSPGQITLIRFLFQFVVFGVWLFAMRGHAGLKAKRPFINAARGALLACSSLMFFIAVKYMPLADAIAIFFVEPLILTVLSSIILREPIGWRRYLAVIVGLCGAIIVVRPSFTAFGTVALLPLGTAFLMAVYFLLNRMAGRVDGVAVMQFTSAWAGALALLAALLVGEMLAIENLSVSFPKEAAIWLALLGMGLCGTIGHILIVRGFQLAPASLLAPFQYAEIIAATLLGWLIFGDFPDLLKWIGIAIIVVSGLFVFWREQKVSDENQT